MSPEIVGPNVFACSEPIHIKYLRDRVTCACVCGTCVNCLPVCALRARVSLRTGAPSRNIQKIHTPGDTWKGPRRSLILCTRGSLCDKEKKYSRSRQTAVTICSVTLAPFYVNAPLAVASRDGSGVVGRGFW